MPRKNYLLISEGNGSSDFFFDLPDMFDELEMSLDDGFAVGVFEVIFENKRVSEMVDITETVIEQLASEIMSEYDDTDHYDANHWGEDARSWLENTDAYHGLTHGKNTIDANKADAWYDAKQEGAL